MAEQGSPPIDQPEVSPEVQRQIAEILAMQQRAQPAPAPNGYRVAAQPASNVIDLDAQLAAIDTSPQPVRLAGHTYQVRRDFPPAEAREVMAMAAQGNTAEGELAFWAKLVGDEDAERLRAETDKLPILHTAQIIKQIMVAAGLGFTLDGGSLGEA